MNNDRVYWQQRYDGTFGVVHVEKNAVGHCISTKAVGSDKRFDITHLYKHPRGEISHISVWQQSQFGNVLMLNVDFINIYQVRRKSALL